MSPCSRVTASGRPVTPRHWLTLLFFSSVASAQELRTHDVPVPDLTSPPFSAVDAPTSYIYGGSQVAEGVWDDTAALFNQRGELECTGTLIAPQAVLTAAHCIGGGMIHEVLLASQDTSGGERIPVRAWSRYPSWGRTFDVAVLHLEHPARTAPRTIGLSCVLDGALQDGSVVDIVGYGITEQDEDNTAKNATRTVVRDHDCSEVDSFYCNEAVSPRGELVAGQDGRDSCNGDSGGPVYLTVDGTAYLIGVTSRAATDEDCGYGGIYVRPDAVFAWLEAQVGQPLPRPACDSGGTSPGANPDGTTTGKPGDGPAVDSGTWDTATWDTGAWDTAGPDTDAPDASSPQTPTDPDDDDSRATGCGCTQAGPGAVGLIPMLGLCGAWVRRRRERPSVR